MFDDNSLDIMGIESTVYQMEMQELTEEYNLVNRAYEECNCGEIALATLTALESYHDNIVEEIFPSTELSIPKTNPLSAIAKLFFGVLKAIYKILSKVLKFFFGWLIKTNKEEMSKPKNIKETQKDYQTTVEDIKSVVEDIKPEDDSAKIKTVMIEAVKDKPILLGYKGNLDNLNKVDPTDLKDQSKDQLLNNAKFLTALSRFKFKDINDYNYTPNDVKRIVAIADSGKMTLGDRFKYTKNRSTKKLLRRSFISDKSSFKNIWVIVALVRQWVFSGNMEKALVDVEKSSKNFIDVLKFLENGIDENRVPSILNYSKRGFELYKEPLYLYKSETMRKLATDVNNNMPITDNLFVEKQPSGGGGTSSSSGKSVSDYLKGWMSAGNTKDGLLMISEEFGNGFKNTMNEMTTLNDEQLYKVLEGIPEESLIDEISVSVSDLKSAKSGTAKIASKVKDLSKTIDKIVGMNIKVNNKALDSQKSVELINGVKAHLNLMNANNQVVTNNVRRIIALIVITTNAIGVYSLYK